MKYVKENIKYFLLFIALLAIDQVTKFWIKKSQPCVSGCSYFRNYDFAFSLKLPHPLIYAIYFVLLSALLYWFYKQRSSNTLAKAGTTFILAGALSNIGERIFQGYVVDFLRIGSGVLNIADFLIIFGILLLISEKPSAQKLD
ncbi:MAG: signal peptidase II [Candidatus Doudnabacteria bacterium]